MNILYLFLNMMKLRKISILSLLMAVFLSFCLYCVDAANDKKISTDLTNAQLTIDAVDIISDDGSATISSNGQNQVTMTTNNFVITSGNNQNKIESSTGSSILGGFKNIITDANFSTIIAGEGNEIKSDNSMIGGGNDNKIYGESAVILGGSGNIVNGGNGSTIIGGTNNTVDGNNSTVGGTNNTVDGNNSTVLGSGASVKANNSFLWSDGSSQAIVNDDDVFVILSKNGLVVNTNKSHDIAQLTIGGSLIVSQNDNDDNIVCGNGQGVGILKQVLKNDSQTCLCTCNGQGWESIYGDGQCAAKCRGKNNLSGICGDVNLGTFQGKTKYEGSCNTGRVVEGSYFVSGYNEIYWSCQEIDGTVVNCVDYVGGSTFNTGCIFEGKAVPHGWNITKYENSSPNCSEGCKDVAVECYNGGFKCNGVDCSLSDVQNLAKSCVGTGSGCEGYTSCTLNGATIPHGASVTGYQLASVPCLSFSTKCEELKYTCDNGSFKKTDGIVVSASTILALQSSCQTTPKSCPGYSSSSPIANCSNSTSCNIFTATGMQCVSGGTKYKCSACESGYTLSGDVCHPDCSAPWNENEKIPYGKTIVGYKNHNQTCSLSMKDKCNTEYRGVMQCLSGGVLSGSNVYKYKTCLISQTCPGYTCSSQSANATNTSCILSTLSGVQCITGSTKYKITCNSGYYLSGCTCVENTRSMVGCEKPWGGSMSHGDKITAYYKSNPTCNETCKAETRTCNNGTLEGTYTDQNCYTNSKTCEKDDSTNTTKMISTSSTVPSHSTKTDTCIEYSANGQLCNKGSTYYTFTCDAGYKWNSDRTKCVKDCKLPWSNETVIAGTQKTMYDVDSTSCTEYCTSHQQIRMCQDDGSRSGDGSYNKQSCDHSLCGDCTFTNKAGKTITIINSSSKTLWSASTKVCSNICISAQIRCIDGKLSGDYDTYGYESCSLSAGSCNGATTIPSHASNYNTCTKYTISGNNMCIDGGKRYTVTACDKCYRLNSDTNSCEYDVSYCDYTGCITPWGTSVAHGAYVKGYLSSNPGCGGSCKSYSAQCNNGDLDLGAYTNETCTERTDCACETSTWGTVAHGAYVTAYYKSNPKCSEECKSVSRKCNNGTLEGDTNYDYGSCSTQNNDTCSTDTFPTTTKPTTAGTYDVCTGYVSYNTTQCKAQYRYKCKDGYTLNGLDCKKDCTFNGSAYKHGDTITKYTSSSVSCMGTTSACATDTATCNNGSWSRTLYPSCSTQNNDTCSTDTFPTTTKPTTAGTYDVCTGYVSYNTTQCKAQYRYKCKDGYTLNGGDCKKNCSADTKDGYSYSALSHGGSTSVNKATSTQYCTATASCNNGTVTISNENCTTICQNTMSPWCNLGSTSSLGSWFHTYQCTYLSTNYTCTCSDNRYWYDGSCKYLNDAICGSTAYNCTQGTSSNNNSYPRGYTWDCEDGHGTILNSCHKCNPGYTWNGSICMAIAIDPTCTKTTAKCGSSKQTCAAGTREKINENSRYCKGYNSTDCDDTCSVKCTYGSTTSTTTTYYCPYGFTAVGSKCYKDEIKLCICPRNNSCSNNECWDTTMSCSSIASAVLCAKEEVYDCESDGRAGITCDGRKGAMYDSLDKTKAKQMCDAGHYFEGDWLSSCTIKHGPFTASYDRNYNIGYTATCPNIPSSVDPCDSNTSSTTTYGVTSSDNTCSTSKREIDFLEPIELDLEL